VVFSVVGRGQAPTMCLYIFSALLTVVYKIGSCIFCLLFCPASGAFMRPTYDLLHNLNDRKDDQFFAALRLHSASQDTSSKTVIYFLVA